MEDSGWRVRLGLEPFRLATDLPLSGLSASYHLDLTAPASLALGDVVVRRRGSAEEPWQVVDAVPGPRTAVHLHVDDGDDDDRGPDERELRLALVPSRQGLLGRALLVASVSLLLLTAVLLWDLLGSGEQEERA